MKTNKDFSIWNCEEVKHWLASINLKRYIENFSLNNVNGYDLCYLTSEDFKTLGISSIHDKNTLLKGIRMKTLEQLQIQIRYESKEVLIQLDFDSNFTVLNFTTFLNEIFDIQSPITIITENNEILSPNIKIIELILLNPSKYKKIKILKHTNDLPTKGTQSHKASRIPHNNINECRKNDSYMRATDDNDHSFDNEHGQENSNYSRRYSNNNNNTNIRQVTPIDEQDEQDEEEVIYDVNEISLPNEETDQNEAGTNQQSMILSNPTHKDKQRFHSIASNSNSSNNSNSSKPITSLAKAMGITIPITSEQNNSKKYNMNYIDSKCDQGFNYDYKKPISKMHSNNSDGGRYVNYNKE